jgi:mono/diheme cytochrome c family protein
MTHGRTTGTRWPGRRRPSRVVLVVVATGLLPLVLGAAGTSLAWTDPAGGSQAAMEAGKKLYEKDCAACHQQNGKGVPGVFPPLAGNPNLKDAKLVVTTIKKGRAAGLTVEGKRFDQPMPPIGAAYTPAQVAEVATYVRGSWGNRFGPVTAEEAEKALGGK